MFDKLVTKLLDILV